MENGYDDDASSVRVAVRIRPLIGREKVERCDECLSVVEEEMQVVIGKNRSFTYDYAFSKYAQQSDIWQCVEPLVKSTFDGYNATIFAYGQTGSGKTYTMGSGSSMHVAPEDYGIIPRVISYIFEQVGTKTLESPHYRAELRIRFLEIYGEEIHDLLVTFRDSSNEGKVSLRETETGAVQVMGATEELVRDADECMRLLERGTLCRTTGSTLMNAHSSRSHAIFTVSMVQHIPIGPPPADGEAPQDGDFETRTSYFNFVDLAGSERQKRTQAEGKRLKEGIDINKGLLALGNVISALGDDKKRGKVHVPYRDSKLTRMLQDSLGGNSRTLMLTCVSPADVNFEETLNALKYANRARNIKNKAVVNRDAASSMTLELRRQVEMLQAEVLRLRNPGLSESELKSVTVGVDFFGSGTDFDSYANLRARAETAEDEVARLTAELKRNKSQMDVMREESINAQAERDLYRVCMEQNSVDGNVTISGEQREEKFSIIKDHLQTISDLQETLRATERERDSAVQKLSEFGLVNYRIGESTSSSFTVPQFVESDLIENGELIARAEKDIEEETALLKKMKSEVSEDDAGGLSDASAGADDDADSSADIDGELAAEETEQAGRQRVFERRQRTLGESVKGLTHEISMKEQLLRGLRQTYESYMRFKAFHDKKMVEMEENVRVAKMAREKIQQEIHHAEKTETKEGKEGGSSRLAKLHQELKVKDEQLQRLQHEQGKAQRELSRQKKAEMNYRATLAEIKNMKRQKVDLIKKMQTERKRYEEEAKQRRREIMSLKRSQQRDKQQIQRLGSQKAAQERVLKRKAEEANAYKLRLKQQLQKQTQAKRKNASYGRNKSANKVEEEAKWLSEEVQKTAQEQQKLEQLQKEYKTVAQEMEQLYAQRERVVAEIQASMSTEHNIRDVVMSSTKTLTRRHSGVNEQNLTPEEKEMLDDLAEQIEACQAKLEFKNEQITDITVDGENVENETALVKIETTQSLPEARTLLRVMFGMSVDLKKQDQLKEQQIQKLQVDVNELKMNLEQERERTQQIKHSYEESLQRVIHGNSGGNFSSSLEHLDDQTRRLLSASEERNSQLKKQCDELENACLQSEQDKQELYAELEKKIENLRMSNDRIQWLESQVARLSTDKPTKFTSQRRDYRGESPSMIARPKPIASTHGQRGAAPAVLTSVSSTVPTGPVSWANEFEDEEMVEDHGDEGEAHHDQDVVMNDLHDDDASHDDRASPSPNNRREFRVELDYVGDNTESAPLSATSRRGQITQRRHYDDQDDEYHYDETESDSGHHHLMADSPTPGSDDSSSTAGPSGSIFSRLSNPTNFTGIHKNRVRDSVSKRELLQNRSERNRSRRLRDRGLRPPPRPMTPTDRAGTSFKHASGKTNSVLEVLANIKRENETEQYVSSPTIRQSMQYVSERPKDVPMDESEASATTLPPPAPQTDVYSRLAGQYTASAQNKRQIGGPTRRQKSDDAIKTSSETAGTQKTEEDVDGMDHQDDGSLADDEQFSSNYDPLLGGTSLVTQVHEDYRERLNNRKR